MKEVIFSEENQEINSNENMNEDAEQNYEQVPGEPSISNRFTRNRGGLPKASQRMGCCSKVGIRRWIRFAFLAIFFLIAILIPYEVIHNSHTQQQVYFRPSIPMSITLENCRLMFYDSKDSQPSTNLFVSSDTAGMNSHVEANGNIILRNSQDYQGSCYMNLEIPRGAVLSGGLNIQCFGTCVIFIYNT